MATAAAGLRDVLSAELLATGACSLAAAMGVAVAAQLALFIELKSVPRLTVAAAIATWAGRYGEMWEYLYAKSVPSELPPDKPRSEKRVLVIEPGFGQGSPDLLARQKMVQLRGAGFVLMSIFPSDPKRLDHNFAAGVAECEAALISFKPHAVISGSRGGMYLMELWRLLDEAGGDLHGWNGASVMLNAHPRNMCNGGVFWGNDIYFARDAPYSDHDEWATPGPDGTKRILLALVITGMSCLGKTGMQLARQLRNVAGHITYDSLVDDLSSLEIFVVKDAHICPAYIIQYTS